jgi:hypothetical protein
MIMKNGFRQMDSAPIFASSKKTRMIKTNSILRTVLAGVAFFCVVSVTAQVTDSAAVKTEVGTIEDLPAKPFRMPSLAEVGGSPFLSEDFKPATVELGQGRIVTDVPVKFNTFNNAILIKKNGAELKLDFFEGVSYDEKQNDGSTKHFMFKAGYPEIDGHNDNSIYQVLSMGPKVHLLKYISQKVEEVPTLGDYSRREIVTTVQLYVYVPGAGIKKISKTSKQAVADALPQLSSQIDEIAKTKGLRLKSESDISVLVEELNKP